jgi:hypothetical protein
MVTIAVIGSMSACGSGDENGAGSTVAGPSEPVVDTAISTSAPVATDLSAATEPEVTTAPVATELVTTVPAATDAPATDEILTLPPTAGPPSDKPLLAGRTYQSRTQATNVVFSIPAAQGDGAWHRSLVNPVEFGLFATPDEEIFVADPNLDYDPGVEVAAVADTESVDDVVATVTQYVANSDEIEAIVEVGMLGGEEVTVIRGRSMAEGPEFLEVPTSEQTRFYIPPGPREVLVYLLQGPTQVVSVVVHAAEEQFDFVVERAAPLLDSMVLE